MENYVEMPSLDSISSESLDRITDVIPNFDFSLFVNDITSGKNIFQPDKIFEFLFSSFANELYSAIKILAVIISIILVSALLENLRSSFGKSTNITISFVTVILVSGLTLKIFTQCGMYCENVANDLTILMNSLLPVMMSLTAGAGFVSTGMIAHPILFYMCNLFAIIFSKILIPLTVIYLTVSMVDLLTDTVELGKFRDLIRKSYNFILGIIMTIFTGLLSVGSFTGVALDSVGAKGAKFALSNMVPFVGRSIAEAMNAVASASVVLKNAVGITGIVIMLLICIMPILKIAAVIITIRIGAAMCEPVANTRSVGVLTVVGDSLSMMNASVISITVMMIISIGIVVGVR